MNGWEKKIIDAFIRHYFASTAEDSRSVLRLRSSILFPDFFEASRNEKNSYLEAAESLEKKGIVKLTWEKYREDDLLKTLSCENFEKLFEETGRPFPKKEAEKIRAILAEKTRNLKNSIAVQSEETVQMAKDVINLIEFFSVNFGIQEIEQGIDLAAMEDLIRLLEFCFNPFQREKITTRALSILLYRDSKHLENLLAACKPLLSQAEKTIPAAILNLSAFERSYPETMIAGKIIIEYKGEKTPLSNAGGHILGIPLENAEEIENIHLLADKNNKTVLTIENKETFYALASPQKSNNSDPPDYDCYLYIGGYLNRAVTAIIKVLVTSGFSIYHAGDLDPDGILILQHIKDIANTANAETPVTPLGMDAATFNQYKPWARTLTKPMLNQIKKIRDETRLIPELTGLIQCFEETGLGVEQEIIDYRFSL